MDVPAAATLETLRDAFERWGLPGRIRVDNGYPWISTGDLPTELGLWLLGLGIELVPNPPRRPQDNGVIECAQNTGKRWADPPRCASAAELQRNLDAMDQHQREGFPDAAHSRLRLFPALAHSGRPYHRSQEAALWQEERLRAKLAEYAVVRQINARGLISIYGRNYYVGRRYAGQSAYVRLDAESGDWLFELADGPVLGRQPAELTREAILERRVTRRHRGQPPVASDGRD
jgi:hypothetical protein